MISWDIVKCGFGKHNFGREIYDVTLDRWVKVCKSCGKNIKVKAPVDEDGNMYDPHEWMMMGE